MSTEAHPSPFELERVDAGEGSAGSAAHARACSFCGDYLAELRREAVAFAAGHDVDAFVSRVRARESATRHQPRRSRPPSGGIFGAAPLVAAGACLAVVLVVAGRPERGDGTTHALVRRDAPEALTAKGRGQARVAALVEHAGLQERQFGQIVGGPGDRFRVELALASAAVLDAWVVDDKGEITELCRGQRFARGTHYLPTTLRFDDAPTTARLFVGPEGSLQQARDSVVGSRVIIVPVRSRGAP